jgi:plastocyanin
LIALLSGLALSRASGGQKSVAPLPSADSATVAVRTFGFRPRALELKVGTAVVWSNEDEIEHTATSGSVEARDSLFDLPLAHKGARAAFTFNKPGTYAYFCARHPFMRGEIHVTLKGDIP